MRLFLAFFTIFLVSCSDISTSAASSSSSIVSNTASVVALSANGAKVSKAVSIKANEVDNLPAKKALENSDFKAAYFYYLKNCNSENALDCALGNYAYLKCELLGAECGENKILKNDKINNLSAKILLSEANELNEYDKIGHYKLACKFDNSISNNCLKLSF